MPLITVIDLAGPKSLNTRFQFLNIMVVSDTATLATNETSFGKLTASASGPRGRGAQSTPYRIRSCRRWRLRQLSCPK